MKELRIGSLLQDGKYRIIGTLGQGGFGITYLAEQVVLHRKVAIKEFFMKEYCERDDSTSQVTLGTTSGSKDLVLRFRGKFIREAQMIASLEHPNIVKIHDIFEENGTAYYVMPYLGSESLSDQVKKNGPLPEKDALRYIRQVASALSYIHGRNSLHFDVKPSNILVNSAGEAVLIDFGISKHYDESGSQTSSTPVGVSKGYAPLEQYQQNEISSFTPATDIYALGATLYTLLTGMVPPSASEVNEDGLPPISAKISKATHDAITKAMQPRRKDRPQNIKEFLDLLDGESDADQTEVELDVTPPIDVQPEQEVKVEQMAKIEKKLPLKWIKVVLAVFAVICGIFLTERFLRMSPTDIASTNGNGTAHESIKVTQRDSGWKKRAVDLGLPSGTLWANCNLGAKSEQDDGDHYAFGTIDSKGRYPENTGNNYKDGESIIGTSADVVKIKWGDDWQLPSKDQFNELIKKCTFVVESRGHKVIGPNGNYIFLPYTRGNSCIGYYWSGNKGYVLEFQSGIVEIAHPFTTYCDLSIRPVKK